MLSDNIKYLETHELALHRFHLNGVLNFSDAGRGSQEKLVVKQSFRYN